MKKIAAFVVFIVIILCHSVYSQEVREVRFVSDPWPPFTIEDGKGLVQGGISIELCRAIFSRLNVKFSSQLLPWKRALVHLKTGVADLTFPLVSNEERSAYLVFTDVVMIDTGRVWFSSERTEGPIEWETVADLKPYKLGLVSGYAHSKIFEQAIKNGTLKTQTCSNYEQGLRMLLHSRMDILLGNESVIYSLIKSHPEWKGKLDFTPNFSSQHAYRIGISKKSPLVELLPDINQLISKMKKDGTIGKIINAPGYE